MAQSNSSAPSLPSTMDMAIEEGDMECKLKMHRDSIKMQKVMLHRFIKCKQDKDAAILQYGMVKLELEELEFIMTQIIYGLSHVLRHKSLKADAADWMARIRKARIGMKECVERFREYRQEENHWLKLLCGYELIDNVYVLVLNNKSAQNDDNN